MTGNSSFQPLAINIPTSESGIHWFTELDQQQHQTHFNQQKDSQQPRQQDFSQKPQSSHSQPHEYPARQYPQQKQQLNSDNTTTTALKIPPPRINTQPSLPIVAPLSPRTPRTPRSINRLPSVPSFDSTQNPSPSTSLRQQLLINDRPPPIPPKSPERGSPSPSPYLQDLSKNYNIESTASLSSLLRLQKLVQEEAGSPNILDNWLICFAIVRFDIDVGPDLKIIQPANITLSDTDLKLISFSSLPEQSINTAETKGQFHMFTFSSTTFSKSTLHGYALFSQQRNYCSPRGFDQESLVIISKLNYPQFFNACLQLTQETINCELSISFPANRNSLSVIQASNSIKVSVIQTAICDIAKWPSPKPNSTIELPLLGTKIHLSIPLYQAQPLFGTIDLETSGVYFHSRNSVHVNSSVSNTGVGAMTAVPQDSTRTPPVAAKNLGLSKYPHSPVPVITATEPASSWDYMLNFVSDISDLYLLYEYLLLVKPIVVYASTPHQCSTFISLLVDLIRPVPYSGQVREYVTIHSCDPGDLDAAGITGVTNPFLIKGINNPDTLVFVLSPVRESTSQVKTNRPVIEYYRDTLPDGTVILGRRFHFKTKQNPYDTLSSEPIKNPVLEQQAHNKQHTLSWGSRLFSALSSKSDTHKAKKTKISSPLSSTFVKLPSDVQMVGLNSAPVAVSSDIGEEIRIKQFMKQSRKEIIKNRLFFPDPKFLSSLNKYLETINTNSSNGALVTFTDATGKLPVAASHSADFAIRFHFSTVTAKFLSPLGCYLDPVEGDLVFSRLEFIHDLKRSSLHLGRSSSSSGSSGDRHRNSYNNYNVTGISAGLTSAHSSTSKINVIESSDPTATSTNANLEKSIHQILRPQRRESIRNMKRRSLIVTSSSARVPLLDGTAAFDRRASMLETSNLGLNFSGPGLGLHAAISNGASTMATTNGHSKNRKVNEAVNELQKQLVYRIFLETPNFRAWLDMNHVKTLRS